jgi:hypothetical protein
LINAADGPDVYEITNNNAHSWVEAYMPGVGWMLFEPTIGFTGSSDVDFDLETGETTPEDTEMPDRPDPLEPEQPETEEAGAETAGPTLSDRIDQFFTEHKSAIIWWIIGSVVAAAILFKIRSKWMPKVLIPYYRTRSGGAQTFEKAYLRLLKQLDLYGIKRREGQTLKSYAAYIDSFFGTHEMSHLTSVYERTVYGGNSDSVNWQELKESWENLINRTSG